MSAQEALLEVAGLTVRADDGRTIVEGVGFEVRRGEIVAVVGESGCGKTMTMNAILGLLPRSVTMAVERFQFAGESYVTPARHRRLKRQRRIGLVPSDAAQALNPLRRIGSQMDDGVRLTAPGMASRARRSLGVQLLTRVGLHDAARVHRSYPHELSGGMQQRVAIAMGVEPEPELLIADEPTTALDVTVQAQILSLLLDVRARTGCAILVVTHDITTVAEISDRVIVMYAGQVVEQGSVEDVCMRPQHPYTRALIESVPPIGGEPPTRLTAIPGAPPQPGELLEGCRFAPRCWLRTELGEPAICDRKEPELAPSRSAAVSRCHFSAPGGDQ